LEAAWTAVHTPYWHMPCGLLMAAAMFRTVTDLARASLPFLPKYVSETVRLHVAAAVG
jgi:hypothetical protein